MIKKVINDDGGAADPSDWTLSATGPSSFSGTGPKVSSGEGFMAGTYDLSESNGPPDYTASDWICDNGTQVDGDTVTLAQGESATCTITNDDDAFVAGQINSGHAGAWFNPLTNGQGVLVDLDPVQKYMFIAWFTYTDDATDNPFEQRWLTAQGFYSGNSATLGLYETLGGEFDAPQAVNTTLIGEVTLTFESCNDGQMSYTITEENLQGEFPLVRVISGSEETCEQVESEASTQAVDIDAGINGAWFEPATSGQGFLIDSFPSENGNFIFVAWFTYGDDTASGQRWLTAQGGFEGSMAAIDVYETTGGSFDDPKAPSTVAVGSMNIEYDDCNNATLLYELTDEAQIGEIAITRVLPISDASCNQQARNK